MLGINIADVLNVLNMIKWHLIAVCIIFVLAVIVIVACKNASKPKKFFIRSQTGIATILVLIIIVNMICFGPMESMISLALGGNSNTISEESLNEASELCTEIAEEGIVLLKNTDGFLPLSGQKLNVFGWSSTNPVYGGTGSGSLSATFHTVSILESLEMAGIEYNTELADFYAAYRTNRPVIGIFGQDWTIAEPSIDEYDAEGIFENAVAFSDTAMIVISRSGGEGADLPTSISNESTYSSEGAFGPSGVRYSEYEDDIDSDKHYLELSNREVAMIKRVTDQFENVIIVINAANAMELGWVNETDAIKSVLLCAGPGQTGFTALGRILNGTINPSGRTVDTYVSDLKESPTWNNFGLFSYENMAEYGDVNQWTGTSTCPSYINYAEGIYMGYRFYETAFAEGLIDYDETVVYPFGYGLSYTSFEQKLTNRSVNNEGITLEVTVTNTGDRVGKDVVQVYCDSPYTNGGIEKSTANLVAFQKTKLLEPGESQKLTLSFTPEDMASYDHLNERAYVLEPGNYVISINKDSHHVIDSFVYDQRDRIVYGANNARSTDQISAVNQFDYAAGKVEYLSRANGFTNYISATAAPTITEMDNATRALFINNDLYDVKLDMDGTAFMPSTGVSGNLQLAELRGTSYEDERWEQLLDQMTVSDMNTLIALGGYQTQALDSVGKLATLDCDGPASINNTFSGQSSIGFPCGTMIASTWNTELAKSFGESIGRMADEMDVSGWYAPAMNLHRSAFGGRNFEYYSEDGVLSGKMAAAAVQGAKAYGVYSYIKHFALNDMETNRNGMICTWANEQSIRELYLKPFEIAVKEGKADAVMSSFNYIGTRWAGGCSELQNTVLRDEWGFRGMVLTDYFGVYGYMNADQSIMNGGDCMLIAYDSGANNVSETLCASASGVIAMRRACKNIMYTVVNSRAYNDANLHPPMPAWKITFIVVDVLTVAGLAVWEILVLRGTKKQNGDT